MDRDIYNSGKFCLSGSKFRLYVSGNDLKEAKDTFAKQFDIIIADIMSKNKESMTDFETDRFDWIPDNINQPMKSRMRLYYSFNLTLTGRYKIVVEDGI